MQNDKHLLSRAEKLSTDALNFEVFSHFNNLIYLLKDIFFQRKHLFKEFYCVDMCPFYIELAAKLLAVPSEFLSKLTTWLYSFNLYNLSQIF